MHGSELQFPIFVLNVYGPVPLVTWALAMPVHTPLHELLVVLITGVGLGDTFTIMVEVELQFPEALVRE